MSTRRKENPGARHIPMRNLKLEKGRNGEAGNQRRAHTAKNAKRIIALPIPWVGTGSLFMKLVQFVVKLTERSAEISRV
jgi:hypothetical protein